MSKFFSTMKIFYAISFIVLKIFYSEPHRRPASPPVIRLVSGIQKATKPPIKHIKSYASPFARSNRKGLVFFRN